MQLFDNSPELIEALDTVLRDAAERGNPYNHTFKPQRARLNIESLDESVQFDFYSERLPGRLAVPRLAGELAVVAFLPKDDERELARHYAVVEKKDHYYGVPAGSAFVAAAAAHFDLFLTSIPLQPVEEVPPLTASDLMSQLAP